ncbi:hypothetical protein EXIGLDRAFT_619562 [Exidia glandulosa HHB12029]|uniref:Zn(2)-C6 fungal-type domain-containing protein n=1 Tax=Exidia glandulosa HHB12029 TaxID=1314781 RepID=A0A165F393_EXIGL|nr:hypothetical protein EXIGLDRAFT_619562 [Exidia glandulosa HHB12029]
MHQMPAPLSASPPSSDGSSSPHDLVAGQSNGNGKRPPPAPSSSVSGSRKKARKSDKNTIPDDDSTDILTNNGDADSKVKPTRGSRACTVCRRLKMKCVGAEHGPPCKRCITGNYECIFEESNRGKRSSKKSEQFQRTLKKMERTIATVLQSITNPGMLSMPSAMVSRSPSPSTQTHPLLASPTESNSALPAPPPPSSPKLHSLPDNALNPLGLLAEASLANRRARMANKVNGTANAAADAVPQVGVANDTYFKPGPMTILPLRRLFIERQVQPEMLSFVSTEEVVQLFNIFFDHMSMHAPLLDRDFHTPSLICSRSPFLLTTICAIASKFYSAKPELHPRLENLAKKLAFSVPERGYKSVEIVQAYLLLSLWGCGPTERYEQDKTWLLLGMGIRMATDLNLHRKTSVPRKSTPEGLARDKEVRNRERTWIMCFILDRSFSAQMGKPHCIAEDFTIRNLPQWYKHPLAIPSDSGLAGYAELQRVLSRSLDVLYAGTNSVSGLQTDCDYLLVIKTIEAQFMAWQQEWYEKRLTPPAVEDPHMPYSIPMGKFYFSYAMLVINSFGLQNALERSGVDMGHFFARCHASAMACLTIARDELGPLGYLKYSPDSHVVQISYAVLSLLKLVRPQFQAFLNNEQQTLSVVKDIADLLESVATGPMHTPALYSTFLRALLNAKLNPPPKSDPDVAGDDAIQNDDEDEASAHDHAVPEGTTNGKAVSVDSMSTLADFQFSSEMGPVADLSTFPPTMMTADDPANLMSMDNILSNGFWDSMLVPGYSNALEGLSGGFVYGIGGSGLITPRLGGSPYASGTHTPMTGVRAEPLTQNTINAAFDQAEPVA